MVTDRSAVTAMDYKFKRDDLVMVRSGRVYRIMEIRNAAYYREDGPHYSARQVLIDGRLYGPWRVFKESALKAIEE
jgi:hypothetical protein